MPEAKTREIKFRVWDRERKIMMYGVEETYDTLGQMKDREGNKKYDYWESCFGDYLNNDNFILMQYTGLKDKKGKEIYEGDIVKIKHRDYLGIIKWRDCGFYIDEGKKQKKNYILNITSVDEVIGNIYENKELLK